MAELVRARRLSDEEGRRLLQIVRRGKHGSVREVIHAFNEKGLAALDPQRAGGRPRLIGDSDIEVIVTAARTRPEKPVRPFTRWSPRKLAGYLADRPEPVIISREQLRQVLPRHLPGAAQAPGEAARDLPPHPASGSKTRTAHQRENPPVLRRTRHELLPLHPQGLEPGGSA